jgi:Tfp pilus assembly protein PilV
MKKTVANDKWRVMRTNSSLVTHHSSLAFTLIEVLVVVTLLALIIFALMAVFNTTQTAFRASITQTDVLEGGRATMDLIANDLKPMSAAGVNNSGRTTNFYAQIENSFNQNLTASTNTYYNAMDDVFFITRQNQTWTGIGYFVRTNLNRPNVTDSGLGHVASLFRYETNASVFQLAANQFALLNGFERARSAANPTNGVSKILDGVMSFKIRAFDTNGFWIATNVNNNILATNFVGETSSYRFYSNAIPMSVEIELGVLEDRALKRVESLPTAGLQDAYLLNQAGKVHIFRQRVSIPNADPAAYQ